MPRVRVPVKRGKGQKIPCPGYLENKFQEMVDKTAHSPDDIPKKFKNKSVRDHNRTVRRLKNEGQITMTQLLGDTNRSSGSDSDFLLKVVKKGVKKVRKSRFSRQRW